MAKQVGINPRKPLSKLGANRRNATKLLQQGRKVHLSLTGNPEFPTPQPSLAVLDTACDDVTDALTASGSKYNRGGKTASVNLADKVRALADILDLELSYVLSIIGVVPNATFRKSLQGSGFVLRNVYSRSFTKIQPVKFTSTANNKNNPPADNLIKWKKPKGLIKGKKLSGFNVYSSTGGVLTPIGSTTKTKFQVAVPVNVASLIVKVYPFSANGQGNPFTFTCKKFGAVIP